MLGGRFPLSNSIPYFDDPVFFMLRGDIKLLESLNGFKFIMAFLNLLILFFVLRKVLFKPVMEFMDKRTKSIEDSIADAEKQKGEAMEMKTTYEAQLKAAKVESKNIIDSAVAKAVAQQENMLDEARCQSEELLAKAREEIEFEREQLLKGVRNEVASLAFAAASRILDANMDTESNRQLIDKFIDEAGAA